MEEEEQTSIPEIVRLLNGTLSYDKATVDSSADGLEHLSAVPSFPLSLLAISKDGDSQGLRIASVTYLKNLIRRYIDEEILSPELHNQFRNLLAESLLKAESSVLRVLLEAFRLVIVKDFVKENSWPELVPQLKAVIQNSNLIITQDEWNTINALSVLQAIVKPFQYFLNPKLPNEPVPEQLEQVATEILVPLQVTFHHFVDKVLTLKDNNALVEYEQSLLLICKSMYFAVRSYMPSALTQIIPSFCNDILRILDALNLEGSSSDEQNLMRLKIAKRGLIIFSTLITRHRKHADKLMQSIVDCALKLAKQSTKLPELDSRSDRIISLAFDVISHVLETGPGWRLVSSNFTPLLDLAIFPALSLNQKDILEWEEDTEEYMRKNLPCELDEASGWAEDLFTARKSARNLLGVIAISKGPPVAPSVSKRKKGEKSKGNQHNSCMGELLVIPFLSKFPIPSDTDDVSSNSVQNYYGVLLAYGSLQDFLKERQVEYISTLLRTRVFPLYLLTQCAPYLLASANWILGELASCLPPAMSGDIYQALTKTLTISDTEDINCYPVRASAAGALASLLDNKYFPPDWLSLLQAVVGRIGTGDDNESSLLFQLIASIIESGQDTVAIHIPGVVSTIATAISKLIPPIPDPWPQMVEKGVASLVVLVQTWVASMSDESKQEMRNIASILSNLLQHAWLMPVDPMGEEVVTPPPSAINDASMLLGLIIQFTNSQPEVEEFKIKELLSVFADIIADYHAWEEMEDQGIFDTIKEAIYSSQKFDASSIIPISFVARVSKFVSEGMNAYSSATWRACTCVHLLFHVMEVPFFNENAKKNMAEEFARVAFSRFGEISDKRQSLWKPLLLVIASCYVLYPDSIERVLEEGESSGFYMWASKLAFISGSGFEPGLSSESELKLEVLTLAKVIDRILAVSEKESDVLKECFVSLLEASICLKNLQEGYSDDEEDEEDDEDDDLDVIYEDDDEDDDDDDEDSEKETREETEEEFLERYAAAAKDSDDLVEEEDEDESDQIIDLGNLDKEDADKVVSSLVEKHKVLGKGRMMSKSLMIKLFQTFPHYQLLFENTVEAWM